MTDITTATAPTPEKRWPQPPDSRTHTGFIAGKADRVHVVLEDHGRTEPVVYIVVEYRDRVSLVLSLEQARAMRDGIDAALLAADLRDAGAA